MTLCLRLLVCLQHLVLLSALISCAPDAETHQAVTPTPNGGTHRAVTPGIVQFSATLESISISAKFSGDSNGDAIVNVQFRKRGESSFHKAYPPYIDRRATIGGVANPYVNEARGSIVGLSHSSTYDVQLTWEDPDGVSGVQPVLSTVVTLSSTPPIGGNRITVTNNAMLASALSAVLPGQTIHLNAGIYSSFTINRSGNPSAWIAIEGEVGGGSVITGAGVDQNIQVLADYIAIKNLTLGASDFHGIVTGRSHHHIIISDNVIQGYSRLCADGPTTTHLDDSGILIGDESRDVLVLANTVVGSTNLASCLQSPSFDGPGQAIGIGGNCTTCVIAGNTVAGRGTRDGIAADNSNQRLVNVDIANNIVSGFVDDGLDFKGENRNVRAWGNVITQDGNGSIGANSCMSNVSELGTNLYGPSYYFRNTCKVIRSAGGCAYKGPSGPLFYFHNSLDATGVMNIVHWAIGCGALSANSGPYLVHNNATIVTNIMIERAVNATFDYNCGTTQGTYASSWDNTTDYATFNDFQAGTGQEVHGINSDPLFADDALHLQSGSPAIDKGIVLNNFNSVDSKWPYSGSAPDIGAYEQP